jgi:hypothetical protein
MESEPRSKFDRIYIYRNGIFFAQAFPGNLTFVDHNQVQGGTVTYGVSALDQNLRQSAMVTFTLY